MYSALYYPFTEIKNPLFLKTSLFLWDKVDIIVPFKEFSLHGRNSGEARALEILANPYVPTEEDKEAAHVELESICAQGLPDELRFELEQPGKVYDIYTQKLLSKTWDLLEDSSLAKSLKSRDERVSVSTGQTFAYYMMSILAICCASDQRRLVTDEGDAYRSVYHLMADVGAAEADADAGANWQGRLLALSFNGLNFADVKLEKLVELRAKEDAMFYELRRHFLQKVDAATQEISVNAKSRRDVKDVMDEFVRSMEADLSELKRALRKNTTDTILSNAPVYGVLAAILHHLEPISAPGAIIGGLLKGLSDYKDRRRKLLREHPSAWMLAAQSGKVPLY